MRVLVVIVLASCGGQVAGTQDDGGTTGTDVSASFDFCAAMQKRAQTCNQTFDPTACARLPASLRRFTGRSAHSPVPPKRASACA